MNLSPLLPAEFPSSLPLRFSSALLLGVSTGARP
jgi:hypothetical protein